MSPDSINLAVKVDVDTLRGYIEGVPKLLGLLGAHGAGGIKASFFFSFGPDNSGKAIRRIFRKGFLSKMFRTKAPSTYGFRTLLYGTLLPAPEIVPARPAIFERACGEGHDCGVHAWDHVLVQDKLRSLSKSEFEALFDKAAELFGKIAGEAPRSYAAPGWQVSSESLAVIDGKGLKYASDTRGVSPFIPTLNGEKFMTPQIPTTLPTMDEILGLPGVNDKTLPDIWMNGLSNKWNVLTVHAEMEGLSKIGVFENFLAKAEARGVKFMTLTDIAERAAPAPSEITPGELPGRSGTVALQRSAGPAS